MTLNKQLQNVATNVLHLNSNNDWGFGGAIKDVFSIEGGYTATIGIACYRHLPSSKFYKLQNDKEILIDTSKKKLFTELLQSLNII